MKNKLKAIIKCICAVLAALVLLDLFCFWYYNPAEYVWDDYRATDNVRVSGCFTSRASEGIAYSVTDEYGYNNVSIPGENGVAILMMGSSHLEGYNVMPDETIPVLLGDMLKEQGYDGFVYNIGTSAHTAVRNIANMDRALERFQPSDYILLEVADVMIHETDIDAAVADSFERNPYTETFGMKWLSGRPVFATLYKQWQSLINVSGEESAQEFEITDEVIEAYSAKIVGLIEKARDTAQAHGVQLVMYYHPHLQLEADGSANALAEDERCLKAFSAACDDLGVIFIDMSEVFLRNYEEKHVLPHGFVNSAPGAGHLNASGNGMIAEELFKVIMEEEKAV